MSERGILDFRDHGLIPSFKLIVLLF